MMHLNVLIYTIYDPYFVHVDCLVGVLFTNTINIHIDRFLKKNRDKLSQGGLQSEM